ncbi:MAG: hypothetical protein ACI4HQ_03405 [Acetatifactor sp.]
MTESQAEEQIHYISTEIANSGFFCFPKIYRDKWILEYSAEDYCGFVKTGNQFLQLSKEEQERACWEISYLAVRHGGKITRTYLTIVYLTKKRFV